MTWKEQIKEALEHLGGEAHLSEIYDYIEQHTNRGLSTTWQATVRGILERSSSDSAAFDGNEDLFYSAMGLGTGFWGLRGFTPTEDTMDMTQDDAGFSEGRLKLKLHLIRERNHQVITLAKKKALAENGVIRCEACEINFEEKYGSIGKDFIEGHHMKPVSQLTPGEETHVDDIALLCPNCHSMIHRRKDYIPRDRLKELLIEDDS